MVYQCEKQLSDLGDKAPDDLKAKIDALLADTKKTLENSGSSLDELKSAKDSLQKGFEELGQEVMKSGGMPEGALELDPQRVQKRLKILKRRRMTILWTPTLKWWTTKKKKVNFIGFLPKNFLT